MKTGKAVLLTDSGPYVSAESLSVKAGTRINIRAIYPTEFGYALLVSAPKLYGRKEFFIGDLDENDVRYLTPLELLAEAAE